MNDTIKPCDPCQWKEHGSKEPCGWQGGVSIRPHLKVHKVGGKAVTVAQYTRKFPTAELGPPANRPTAKHVEALNAAKVAPVEEAQPEIAPEDREAKTAARAEVLWNLVERDPASEVLCRTLAADEVALEAAQDQANLFTRAGEYDKLQKLNKAINDIADRVIKAQQALGVTADQRRRNNQIGADAGCQIISNYGNVLRKMATPAKAAFLRRTQTFVENNWNRIYEEYLSKVENELDGETGVAVEQDYRTLILGRTPTL